jgi:hypothetical protein
VRTFYGKPLAYVIAFTSMMLNGIEASNISHIPTRSRKTSRTFRRMIATTS